MVARDHENPVDKNADNVYRVTATATDEDGNSASASFTVTVTDMVSTLALSGLSNKSVTEHMVFTSAIPVLTGTPDGGVAWTLEGADSGDFTVSTSTGVVSMVGRDFETPVDANKDNVYQVTLKATDDDGSATASFSVTILDEQEVSTLTIGVLADTATAENDAWTSSRPTASGAIGTVIWGEVGGRRCRFRTGYRHRGC